MNEELRSSLGLGIVEHVALLRSYARRLAGADRADTLLRDCIDQALGSEQIPAGADFRDWLFGILTKASSSEDAGEPIAAR